MNSFKRPSNGIIKIGLANDQSLYKEGLKVVLKKCQWGTIYNQTEDLIRISGKVDTAEYLQEKLLFTINKSGKVSIVWGNKEVSFNVNKGDKSKE